MKQRMLYQNCSSFLRTNSKYSPPLTTMYHHVRAPCTQNCCVAVEIQPGMANCYEILVAAWTVQQAQHVAVTSESWCVVFWSMFDASAQSVLHD